MSDYQAPTGPPPPRVPEGWKAVWNQQYQEWFYVNLHTKESTWEKPTVPAYGPGEDAPPGAPPPSYQSGPHAPNVSDTKKTYLESNNPYNHGPGGGETDEELARRLQREEDERSRATGHSPNPAAMGGATGDRGHSDSYYQNYSGTSPQPPQSGLQGGYPGGPTPGANPSSLTSSSTSAKRSSGGGLFGKLKDKLSNPQGSSGGYPPRPAGYGQQLGGHMPQQAGYGGYPQQQGYGGYPQQHGYGGYPQHGGGFMGQPARKKPGMGAGGAAALGVGGGLLGGMLLADAIDDHDDYGGGGDYGGGDDMGDMGGGDF